MRTRAKALSSRLDGELWDANTLDESDVVRPGGLGHIQYSFDEPHASCSQGSLDESEPFPINESDIAHG